MNNNNWSRDNWFCTKPKVVPQFGTIPTRWQYIRHVRFKRQLPIGVGSEHSPYRYPFSNEYDRSGYGDRSYGHSSSGYGHSSSGYGSHSGYGHSSYDYHDDHHECCPLVIDPLVMCALLGFIAAATWFLRTAITMNMNIVGRKRRRKKRSDSENSITPITSHKLSIAVNNIDDSYSIFPSTESDEVVINPMSYFSNILYQGK